MSTQRGNQHTAFALENFSNSGASGLYDRARPDYPAAARDSIFARLPANSTAIELGAGTGLFSRLLLADGSGKLAKLICTEPSEGMRQGWEIAFKKMEKRDESIKVEIVDGVFDNIPAEDASADLVIAAQAFHWIGTDGASTMLEIARVLKPGGNLILIWNLEDPAQPWVNKLRSEYEQYEAGTPQYRLGLWKSIFEDETYMTKFEPYEHEKFHRTLPTTTTGVVDRVLSKSYITALDDKTKVLLTEKINAIMKDADDKVWIDEAEGTFQYPYATDMFILKKRST